MMKKRICNLMLAVFALTALQAAADTARHDTVYFYKTWEQVLYMEPSAMAVDPYVYPSAFDIEFWTENDHFNDNIDNEFIAATVGDSIWLINSHYLSKNFKGDAGSLKNYVPLFFNDKVAYAVYEANLSVKELLLGDSETLEVDYYYIDFYNNMVRRITHSTLSELLDEYHDLQMRYEGMKDYKKRYMIEYFFFKYVDRATEDYMRPYILDLMD